MFAGAIHSRSSPFVMQIDTTNSGTPSNQFQIIWGSGSYNYSIDWGDGVTEYYTDGVARTHTYSSAGKYFIKIRGAFPAFAYNNSGDKEKIIAILYWGEYGKESTSQSNALFLNSVNLKSLPAKGDNFRGVTNFSSTFRTLGGLTSFPLINTSSGTNFDRAFNGNRVSYYPLFDLSKGTSFFDTFSYNTNLLSLDAYDVRNGTRFDFFCFGCSKMTTVSNLYFRNLTRLSSGWQGCSALTDFAPNVFDNWIGVPIDSCFEMTWDGCKLTSQSVENILVSINVSGRNAPSTGKDITISYDVNTGALSGATNAAISSLKSRGWLPQINGVYV